MANNNNVKRGDTTFRLSDEVRKDTKWRMEWWADALGLKIPSKLNKADYADKLEEMILLHPEAWLERLTRYELEMFQMLVKAGKGGDVTDRIHQIHLASMDLGMMDFERDFDDRQLFHFTMPDDLREAIAPHIDKVLADPVNQQFFDLQQYALGVLMLYGAVPEELFIAALKTYFDQHNIDPKMRKTLGNKLFHSVFVRFGSKRYWSDDQKNIVSIFVSPALEDFNDLLDEVEARPILDYKPFTVEEFMAAGQIPMHEFPCKGYNKAFNFLNKHYKDEDASRVTLLDMWMMDQHGVDMFNLVTYFIPQPAASEKVLNQGMSVCTDYLNSLPLWRLKGYSPDEVLQMMPQNDRAPRLTLGPNLTAAGYEMNPEFQSQLDAGWGNPDMRITAPPFIPAGGKVGRNDPCPCGSGKKYKHCCGKTLD